MSNHSIRVRHGSPFRRALLTIAFLLATTAAVVSYLAVTSNAGADSITLLPNGDRTNEGDGWERGGSGNPDCANGGANSSDMTCSSDIDEDVDGSADAEYIQTEATNPDDDDVEFNFDNPLGSTNQISQVAVRFRARYIDQGGTDSPSLQVVLRDAQGNNIGSQTFTNITQSFANYSFTVNTTLSQAEGDGLYVSLKADGNRQLQVSAVNLDVTYSTVTANPPLAASCGIDMVLVIDSSGSIDGTELNQMKTAYQQFVSAFLPNTPTQIGIVEFDTTTVATTGFTNNTTTLNNAITAANSGGFTNWEDAMQDARALFPGRAGVPDLIVFASDGNPNTVIGGNGGTTAEPAAVLAAVNQANAAKAAGIRIITLGIGNELDQSNLESLSSEDAFFSSGFSNLATTLAQLADDLCGGTITVQKIIDQDGDPTTTTDQTNGANWSFTASVSTAAPNADDSIVAPATALTDVNGQHNFDINLGANGTSTATITETPQAGFAFKSAACANADNNGSPTANGVTGIVLSANDIVNCKFYNQPGTTFTVNKNFIPDSAASVNVSVTCTLGATVTGGTQAVTEASPKSWTVSNFTGNPVCTATESPVPAGYTASGAPAGTCSASLLPNGSCTITNTRNDTTFTVNKTWIPASGAGVSVTVTCTSGTVVEGAQTVTTAAPKTWTIQGYTAGSTCTGTESPVPAGYTASGTPAGTCTANIPAPASCTITNSLNAVTFTVNKTWVPASGAAVSVTVSCTAPATASPGAQNVTTAAPGSWTINNFTAGVTQCTATESPIPTGYTASGSPAGTCVGTVGAQGGTCTITNTRRDSTFVVKKTWVPASAAGVSVTVSCTSGTVVEAAQTVTTAAPKTWNVQGHAVGATCTATETVPSGYTASGAPAGTCTGGIPTPGECTITNTRNDTTFTVNKVWSPASAASVSVTVTCTGGGTVVEGAQSVSTAAPKTWNIQGYVTTPNCTATESPIPVGYTASGSPAGTCTGTAPGNCTITNTLSSKTFTVHKLFTPDLQGGTVTVSLSCTPNGGTSAPPTASAGETPLVDAVFTVTGYTGDPTCTATETGVPAGYTTNQCSALLSVGQCTITNTRNDTTFTVNKVWVPASAATVTVSITCTGGGTVVEGPQQIGSASPFTWHIQGYVTAPTCTATESPIPAGYSASGTPAGTCSGPTIGAAPGSCTITNTQSHSDFRVTKDFIPDLNLGTVLVTVNCTSGTVEPAQLAGETPSVIPSFDVDGFTGDPTCTATEANVPAGYSTSSCSALLSVGTCKITNTKPATIVVQKTTNPAGDPQSFTVQLTGPQNDTGSITDATDENFTGLTPGLYTITELNVSGWKMDGVQCTGGNPTAPVVVPGVSTAVSVTVNYGDIVTCTYSNIKLGTIIVQKTTNPAGDATQFPIGLTGPTPGNGTVTDALDLTFTNREPGNYTVTETLTPPWVMTSVTCPPSTQPVVGTGLSFTLPAGGTITCLFTNRTEKTFDVYKDWVNETKADTVSVSLVCDSGTDTPASANASETVPATFTVTGFSGTPNCTATESAVPAGYVSSGTCSAGLLNPGQCTISNTLRTGDFQVIKDFVPNPADPNLSTSISLVCDSGTVANSPRNATDTVTADFTVNGHNGDATICTATENLVPGYDASGNPPGTCQATILVGVCTITNTQQSKSFDVLKDFQPDSAASVAVTLSCGSGTVSPPNGFASEATPASFTVTGATGDPDCTATENPIPGGYNSSGTCTAKLSVGQCTIVNVQIADTFTVHKDFSDDNPAAVTVTLQCANGTVSPPSAQVTELAPFTFDVTGSFGNPLCVATENPVPAGYTSTTVCQASLSIGQCTIVNTAPSTPTPTPPITPTPTQPNTPTDTPVETPTPTATPTATPTEPPTATPITPTVNPETQTPVVTDPPTNTPEPTQEPETQTPVITDPPTDPPTNSPSPSPTVLPATQTPKATPTALPVTRFPNTGDLPLGDEGAVAWLLIAAGMMAITAGAAFTVMARKR